MYILFQSYDYEGDEVLGIYDTLEQAEAQFLAALLDDMPTCGYIKFRVVHMEANRAFNDYENGKTVLNSSDYGDRSEVWYYIKNVTNSDAMPTSLEGLKALSDKLDRQREEAFRAYDHEAKFEGYRGEVVWH